MAEFAIIKSSRARQKPSLLLDNDESFHSDDDRSDNSPLSNQLEWETVEKVYLPPEILLEVMSYMDFDSIVASSGLSRGFYEASQDDELWRRLLSSDWKPLKEDSPNTNDQNTSVSPVVINNSNHDEAVSNSSSYELLDQNNHSDNYEKYKERYLRYKKWRDSIAFIYSEERKQYMNNVETQANGKYIGYLKYFLSFPILFYRLLIFLFISQDEQPDYGLTHEFEYIQEKSLRAGGSLVLIIIFAPMLFSTWMIGELPASPFFATLHVLFKILFTILCIVPHFFNRMDKNIEFYKEANKVSLLIIVQTALTLVLMRYVDDFIICCLIAFNMSTALGLAISLKHMIKNTESIEGLFDSSNAAVHHYLSPIFEIFRNRPVATNLILVNLMILVIMIGGFKTFVLIVIFIVIAVLTGGNGGGGSSGNLDLDRRTIIFFVVVCACIFIFSLATVIIGGNYKRKSRARNAGAIVLLLILTLSFISLTTRVLSIKSGETERWNLSLFDITEEQ